MTLLIPPGYASVLHSLRLSGDPDPYAITYGISLDADPVDINNVATNLHNRYIDNINPTNPNVLSLVETLVKYNPLADPGAYVEGVEVTPAAGAGTSTNLVPQNTALLVHKRTASAGRTGRGRMYFPALNEANVDMVGAISGGWLATMNTALAAWRTAINGTAGIGNMVLLHDSAGAGALHDPTVITALAADPICATQRRRLRK